MTTARTNPRGARKKLYSKSVFERHVIWGAFAIALFYMMALLVSAKGIGYSRDESFYFDAADRYFAWFKAFFEHPETAIKQFAIDSSFSINHEHPPFMKTLFGLSHHWLYEQYHWFSEPGLSYRFPAMLVASLGVAVIVLWGTRTLSVSAGIVAGLVFAFMPRVFHHAHLACFDVPVATLCLCCAYLWSRALESGQVRWILSLGVAYGVALATKHNAWMLPVAFITHGICVKGAAFLRGSWVQKTRLIAVLLSPIVLGPLVLYLLWPWLWFDTAERLKFWFQFHLKHEYYNMEFLGVTYWKPPMPLGYAWLMTLATVPLTTLGLFLLGGYYGARATIVAAHSWMKSRTTAKVVAARENSDFVLWLICLCVFYAPWLSSETPIFGGTKHWFTAYPFLALIAARGFEHVRQAALQWFPAIIRDRRLALGALTLGIVLAIAPGLVTVYDMGPWGLSTYMPVVGGASGAATLGLNRTFWGYTTLALSRELNDRAPARVFLHDMTIPAWNMHVRDGSLKKGLYGTNSVVDSDLALYQHEPHMGRVEYQIWAAYGTSTPIATGTYEGVPVVWLYERARANAPSR
jgi:4-amino-4-deoxy-L-arabinose transferase-like glycosyltransferase